jgi:hypothetical protein
MNPQTPLLSNGILAQAAVWVTPFLLAAIFFFVRRYIQTTDSSVARMGDDISRCRSDLSKKIDDSNNALRQEIGMQIQTIDSKLDWFIERIEK